MYPLYAGLIGSSLLSAAGRGRRGAGRAGAHACRRRCGTWRSTWIRPRCSPSIMPGDAPPDGSRAPGVPRRQAFVRARPRHRPHRDLACRAEPGAQPVHVQLSRLATPQAGHHDRSRPPAPARADARHLVRRGRRPVAHGPGRAPAPSHGHQGRRHQGRRPHEVLRAEPGEAGEHRPGPGRPHRRATTSSSRPPSCCLRPRSTGGSAPSSSPTARSC